MSIDASSATAIFDQLGTALRKPATLCLIGSTPGIASGQPEMQTPNIDVWLPGSEFDTGDLSRACREIGILFDPKGEIRPGSIYIQIVRLGIVRLPKDLESELIGRYGNLTLLMPNPAYLAAAKLIRGSEIDIDDVVWWVRQRNLDATDIERAIARFANESDREAAVGNMIFVRLVVGEKWS